MNEAINLYDTATKPTMAMREAMFHAQVGDDVYGTDPTINQLEAEAAAAVGKAAALFVPSGTMGNLIALMTLVEPGSEVILEAESHIYYYEAGGLARIAGLMPRLVPGNRGVLAADDVRKALRPPDSHYAPTRLICVENTHNRAGGTITPPETMRELRALADEHGLRFHLDGARIFNAAVALRVPVTEFTSQVDTVMFCLSKGLGAPVGSILAGDEETIRIARNRRKLLGGGMRQAGVLAAAGLVALHEGIDQLEADHKLTCELAEKLQLVPGIQIDMEQVQTNMVMLDVSPSGMSAREMGNLLEAQGIITSVRPPYLVRMVVHRDIRPEHIDRVVAAVANITMNGAVAHQKG